MRRGTKQWRELGPDAMLAPRGLVVIEAGARASLVESYVSLTTKAYFTNTVIEVVMGAVSWLEHTRVQRENESAWHIGFTQVDQSRDSHYRSFTLAMGGRLSRHNIHTRLGDSNVETLLYGLYLTSGTQLADTHSAIYHDHPNCNSWEVYKGVLADKSRAAIRSLGSLPSSLRTVKRRRSSSAASRRMY